MFRDYGCHCDLVFSTFNYSITTPAIATHFCHSTVMLQHAVACLSFQSVTFVLANRLDVAG